MSNVLGVEGECYRRGYEGKRFPLWARKDGPLWKWYQQGKKDAKEGVCKLKKSKCLTH